MIVCGGTASTARTSTVFWTVMAVIAVMPWTPQRAKAFRSAWMPAPPPESEPAIDSTAGTGRSGIAVEGSHGRSSRGGQIAASYRAPHVAEHLELGQAGQRLAHAQAAVYQRVDRLAPLADVAEQRPQPRGHLLAPVARVPASDAARQPQRVLGAAHHGRAVLEQRVAPPRRRRPSAGQWAPPPATRSPGPAPRRRRGRGRGRARR